MYLLAVLFGLGCLLALILTPLVRNLFQSAGMVDVPDSDRKLHAAGIPRAGGIAIFLSYLICLLFGAVLPFTSSLQVNETFPRLQPVLLAAGIVFLGGLLDDIYTLKPWHKILFQVAGGFFAWQGGVAIRVDIAPEWNEPVGMVLTLGWLVFCSNAFNLIDGLDGLAAGVGFFATMTTFVAAMANNTLELMLFTAPLAGALLGFLRYNFNPASIFLGDCGSLSVGFLLGCFAVLWSQKSATVLGMTAPLMAVSIPLLDALVAMARRAIRNKSIFAGDRGHVHHVLIDRGLTTRQAAMLLYGVCGIAAVLSLAQNTMHARFGGFIVIAFCAAAWIGVQHLGYVEFGMIRQLFFKGTLRKMLDSEARLGQFRTDLEAAENLDACWTALQTMGRDLGFSGTRFKTTVRVYVDPPEGIDPNERWQLRIPLVDGQHVNFYSSPASQPDCLFLNLFVATVTEVLNPRMKAIAEAKGIADVNGLDLVP
jgi:UDP-GlcNAc:undecaprenyl-phosphate/decaprenyl-phosphate GlcNAc-1-phosphate transferase